MGDKVQTNRSADAPFVKCLERIYEQEEKILLEPIRFRYSTEKIVEDPQEVPEITEDSEKPARSRNRRRKANKPADQQPQSEKTKWNPKEPKAEPQAAAEGETEGAKKPRRRPNHRRRRSGSKPAGEEQQ